VANRDARSVDDNDIMVGGPYRDVIAEGPVTMRRWGDDAPLGSKTSEAIRVIASRYLGANTGRRERGGGAAGERARDGPGQARRSQAGPGVQGVGGMVSLPRVSRWAHAGPGAGSGAPLRGGVLRQQRCAWMAWAGCGD
jgi:hypothetical protein